MGLKKLFIRGQNLLVNPSSEFKLIKEEKTNVAAITKSYTLPIAFLVGLFTLVGSAFSNMSLPINSFLYIMINALIVFSLIICHIYVSGKAISMLGQNICSDDKASLYYTLTAYSQLPFFLILAVIKLFPSLIFLVFLGFYSALLFYTGSSIMTRIPAAKRMQFTILSILIMVISFILFSELFTLLYSEIIDQLSTFAVY
ncbi:MAG: YIP1 family protein [Bacteroidales bacterium]